MKKENFPREGVSETKFHDDEIFLHFLVVQFVRNNYTSFKKMLREIEMPTRVKIVVKDVTLDAEFSDTECARQIVSVMPIDARPNEWGDEFYFTVPVQHALDNTATTSVSVGDIGYWPPGSALAIFFGPTPASVGVEPVPASSVNLVGRITGDAALLRNARGAKTIRIEPRT